MSAVPVAPVGVEPLELYFERCARAGVSRLRDGMEYVRDEGPMSGVRASVAMDVVFAVRGVVAARGMV